MTDLAFTRRRLLQIAALAPLAGCSIGGGAGPRTFSLNPLMGGARLGPAYSLGIDAPKALKGLDSERIAYRSGPNEIQYYADADWIDLAPEMVQMVLVRSFQNRTNLAVSDRSVGGTPPDFVLTSLLQEFEADAGKSAHVTLVVTLSPANRRRIARTWTFEAGIVTADDHIESVVAAFDKALGAVASDLIGWTLKTVEEEKKEV
jgi:cholesterol transport system auxiliary component